MSNGNSSGKIDAGNNEPKIDGSVDATVAASGYQPAPGEFVVDPSTIGNSASERGRPGNDDNNSGTGKRKRGRPAGSTNANSARAKTAAPLDVDGITAMLLSSHAMLAALVRVPEMQIDATEAAQLSKGIVNVARHYDIVATQKTIDWSNLIMVLAMIYGTRMVAIGRNRKFAKEQAANKAAAEPIIDFGKAKASQAGIQ